MRHFGDGSAHAKQRPFVAIYSMFIIQMNVVKHSTLNKVKGAPVAIRSSTELSNTVGEYETTRRQT